MSAWPAAGSAIFFVLAPGTVAGLVPYLLTRWERHDWYGWTVPARVVGALLLVGGLAALVECFRRFATEGRGTPAPIAPPQTLVVHGLYRHVRNPIYVALLTIVAGEALLLGRFVLLGYAVVLWLLFTAFVILYEEPKLRATFGVAYARYRATVPRWVPRLTPADVAPGSPAPGAGSATRV
jgi:protein-S-isoprenylcysteine O-methyltransferase Ste14